MVPYITHATVISQDPDNYAVFCTVDGTFGSSGPTVSISVGTQGPRDAVRGSFPHLPLPGQRGVVCFPRLDPRNGVWLCSISPALNDANTMSASGTVNLMPQSHAVTYAGNAYWEGPDGSTYAQYPDGSTLQVGPTAPTVQRHIVNGSQRRQSVAFPLSQRVASAPGAFALGYTQGGTGAACSLSAAGAWTMTAAAGQSLTLQVSGGASIVISGNTITMQVNDGVSLTMAGSTATLTNGGGTATVVVGGEVTATMNIVAGLGGADQVTLQQHVHGTGTAAAGTSVPTPGH